MGYKLRVRMKNGEMVAIKMSEDEQERKDVIAAFQTTAHAIRFKDGDKMPWVIRRSHFSHAHIEQERDI